MAMVPIIAGSMAERGSHPSRPTRATSPDRRKCHNVSVTTPVRIHAEREAGTLQIGWDDGHETTYSTSALRWLCPCAYCRGEAGLPGWLDSAPTLTSEQTRLVDVQLVGNYALAPSWGDGHHTGYYTFDLLRHHCPCPDCSAARGAVHQEASA
jgi:DUF971 family protein